MDGHSEVVVLLILRCCWSFAEQAVNPIFDFIISYSFAPNHHIPIARHMNNDVRMCVTHHEVMGDTKICRNEQWSCSSTAPISVFCVQRVSRIYEMHLATRKNHLPAGNGDVINNGCCCCYCSDDFLEHHRAKVQFIRFRFKPSRSKPLCSSSGPFPNDF